MDQPAKAYLQTETGRRIDCLFNPAELTISKSNSWTPVKGKGRNTPQLRFQEGQSGSMTMSLTLDTTADGSDVTRHTNALLELMRVDTGLAGSDSQRNRARPPWVQFHWGDLHSFKAIVERLQIKFTYFASTGVPLRAKADLTLKQYEDEQAWGAQNPTSGTPLPHRLHHVRPGETLDRIASSHYGDPARWRLLAEANGVIDPLALRPGDTLVIPEPKGVRRG
jgi:hypothetical protein